MNQIYTVDMLSMVCAMGLILLDPVSNVLGG
jgi:hypothetical protein